MPFGKSGAGSSGGCAKRLLLSVFVTTDDCAGGFLANVGIDNCAGPENCTFPERGKLEVLGAPAGRW